LQRDCADIKDCKYPSVKALLIGSNYFDGKSGCRCIERTSVYSAEWDSERKEYFNRWFEGVTLAAQSFERLFSLEGYIQPEMEKIVKQIPGKHRKKIIEVIQHIYPEAEIPESIIRVLIYSGDIYNGFVDITPWGNIDDAFLKPPLWMKAPLYWVTCKKQFAHEKILRPDPKETIECVPYVHVGVESRIGVCAQYAVRLALMNLLQRVPTVPELTYWLQRPQKDGWTAERITQVMSEAIRREGLTAFRYSSSKCPICNELLPNVACTACKTEMPHSFLKPTKENIYAYIESGIPVILGVERAGDLPWWDDTFEEGHALVGIGHTLSNKGDVTGFIVHDVSTYPYQVLQEPLENGKSIEDIIVEAIVPLYHEIVINYPTAKELALEMIDLGSDLSYRPQLVEANKIKKWLAEGEQREHFLSYSIHEKVKESFSNAYISRYAWLFEIKQELGNGTRKYVGDIIISAEEPRILGFNFPLERICAYIDEKSQEPITLEY